MSDRERLAEIDARANDIRALHECVSAHGSPFEYESWQAVAPGMYADALEALRGSRERETRTAEALEAESLKVNEQLSQRIAVIRERDDAVSIALWLAAIDQVPIADRIQWVSDMQSRYGDVVEARRAALVSEEPPA